MRVSGRRPAALALLEVLIAITLLGMGLIMTSAALSLAVRDAGGGNDLATSQLAAHVIAGPLLRDAEALNLPPTDGVMCWFGPTSAASAQQSVTTQPGNCGQNAVNGSPAAPAPGNPWLVDDSTWGTAIPYPADARYAGQIFYRSRGRSPPYDWDFFIVIQAPREGRFAPPTAGGANVSGLICDRDGKWSRGNGTSPSQGLVFAVPGGVAVYHFAMCF